MAKAFGMNISFFQLDPQFEEEYYSKEREIKQWEKDLQSRNDAVKVAKKKERDQALLLRLWEYTIIAIDAEWSIIMKTAHNPVEGAEDNTQWTMPFKVINNVIVVRERSYNGKCWTKNAQPIIPNGALATEFDFDNVIW
jgi:hypothetical protein